MTRIDSITELFPSFTFRWTTPDGVAYINVIESSPITIRINIGKSGTSVASWAYALAEMLNIVLQTHSVNQVIDILTGITTHQSSFSRGVECRSAAEAVGFSLTEYLRVKRKEEK